MWRVKDNTRTARATGSLYTHVRTRGVVYRYSLKGLLATEEVGGERREKRGGRREEGEEEGRGDKEWCNTKRRRRYTIRISFSSSPGVVKVALKSTRAECDLLPKNTPNRPANNWESLPITHNTTTTCNTCMYKPHS